MYKMRSMCDDAFTHLLAAIRKEHLILEHLVESIPSRFAPCLQTQVTRDRLSANAILKSMLEEPANRLLPRSLSQAQSELWLSTDQLLRLAENDEDVMNLPTVNACLLGLAEAREASYQAMLKYNHSIITMSAFTELSLPSIVCRLMRRESNQRTLIDWTPDVSI
ncbi:hypothetical protein Q31b_05200 [Novipirellula aureliae]|uniref:Uncharacterized protein n=2 Tax=Novipirellula aureliae TaxID=2527966 RepID=A0A5C6E941_9BACT|nr:hypothetical protein Q31b_05200 [Novipirellula aureliae]